jgi:hypothetical protein
MTHKNLVTYSVEYKGYARTLMQVINYDCVLLEEKCKTYGSVHEKGE